jgi:hypothetical protein
MGDSNANSYDLLQAQKLLATLTKKQGSSVKEHILFEDISPYVSLSKLGLVRSIGLDKKSDPVGHDVTEQKNEDLPPLFDSWDNCIAWCMTLTRAEAVFAVDSQGFVIACRGRAPSQGYEGAGAELICSIEQLERIAPDAGKLSSVDLEFDKKRLAGFVAAPDENEFYVIGLIAPEALSIQTKQRILVQITGSLLTMD